MCAVPLSRIAILPSLFRSQRLAAVSVLPWPLATWPLVRAHAARPAKLLLVVNDSTAPPGVAAGVTAKPPPVAWVRGGQLALADFLLSGGNGLEPVFVTPRLASAGTATARAAA